MSKLSFSPDRWKSVAADRDTSVYRIRESDPAWQKNNLEYDLRTTDWIVEKVRKSETYAQNLYAALCNNDFVKNEIWDILQDKIWACSWRAAGGIIADMIGEGSYTDWYCSGIAYDYDVIKDETYQFKDEGVVTPEIKADLLKLGWTIK